VNHSGNPIKIIVLGLLQCSIPCLYKIKQYLKNGRIISEKNVIVIPLAKKLIRKRQVKKIERVGTAKQRVTFASTTSQSTEKRYRKTRQL